jgi:hypothetical protein
MNYIKLEELFVDYILSVIAPDSSSEKDRNEKCEHINGIITDILGKELSDYITYVIPYGSFPVKFYLKDADIDLTLCFVSKRDRRILINIPLNYIDNILSKIKEEFEKRNTMLDYELFSDIEIIKADIRLLKCKIGNINIDITINNFSGLYKILFIDYIEEEFRHKFNFLKLYKESSYSENKRNLFRRTFLLIKGWCLYEGKLMGSNMGLMASYTLEILIIYLFNNYYDDINNEFEGFEKFFEIMQTFNFEKEIISLYETIPKENFFKKLEIFNKDNKSTINEPFWYLEEDQKNSIKSEIKDETRNKEPLLNLDDTKRFINNLIKGMEYSYLRKEGNVISITNFDKMVNVLDPINNHNNLGKSINYHNKSKMKMVISFMIKKLKNIQDIRKSSNPFIYMNSLLNLFKETLSSIDLDLFEKSLKTPKILVNSNIYKKFIKIKEDNICLVEKEDISKFNSLFSENGINNDINQFIEEEDFDEYAEGSMDKSEKTEEEDEDPYEEEINTISNDNNETSEDSENDIFFEIKENVKFEYVINKDIMKKIFELYENKQNSIKSNNEFIKQSKDYSSIIQKFLKEHNLI